MFQPDEDRDLAWEHQCQMLQDFEKIALGKNIEDHSAAAALQAGFCYIAGFGAEIDHNNAVRFLKRSEELNHPVARLFGSTLESVIGNDVSDTGLNYANQVVLGFQWKALLKPSKFEVHFLELFPDGPVPTCTFEDHASYRAWLLAIPPETVPHLMHSHVVMVTTSSKMNHLELAIAMDDIDSVHFLETCFLPSGRGLNGKPFLIQAFEKGNFDMINTLLDFGADPQVTTEDGFTIYHWLFVLGQGAILIARRLRSAHHSSNLLLNTPCPASIVLHPQWPLEISGTPLASAITSGSIAAVQALLELGANPLAYVYSSLEVKDPRSGWTPFHLAMKYHSAEIIALLLQATGAKDPYKALQSVKRLNISADLGQCLSSSSIVERYAIHGKDHRLSLSNAVKTLPLRALEHVTKDGKTALMQAIDFSDLDVVKVLLQAHPGLAMKPFFDPQKESSFNYPAHFAAQISARHESVSSFEVLKFLVQDETVIQSLMDSHRRTLLHLAVTGSSSNTSQWLLDKGASHELTDMDGRAPIHYAGSAANVKLLLDAGAEVNMLDKFSLTPLDIAALAGSEELTRALINNDADITISSPRHGTPLHCGITRRSRIVIETILEAAKALNQDSAVIINCLNRDGDTALHTAIQTSRSDVVRVLLSFGADINVRNRNSGHTPLHQCVLSGDAEFIRWYMSMAILHENFDIDARDFQQRTPLHYAATIGHVEAAQMLLQRGAQVDARDSKGNTALNLVVAASDKAIRKRAGDRVLFISVLNSFGASLISENNKGQRAWDYAYSRIDFNLMILLLERGGPVACRNATLPGTETGNKLFDRALKESKWDFIKLLLSQIFLLRPTPTHNCLSEWITILDEKKLRVAGTKNEAEILSVLSLWIDRIDPKISGKVRNNMESTKAAERAVSDAHKIYPQLSNLEQRQISRLHTIFDAATTHAALCSLSAILLSNLTSLRNINLPLEECQQLKNFSFSGKRLYYKPFEQLLQRGKSDSENSQFQYESWNCARIKKYSELVSQAKKCSRDDLKLAIFGLDSTVYDFSFRRYMTKAMAGLSFSQAQEQKNYTEIYLRAHNAERPAQSFSDDGQESDFVLATTLVKYLCEKNKTALKSLFMTLGQDENLCLTSEPPSPSFLSDEARNWLYKAW
jgi:ankyrin repeat protein